MFYSRPQITPLNWDFVWLRPNGSMAFVGLRSDNRLVDFKYRNGWLQAWLSAAGDKSDYGEQIIKEQIGPIFHSAMDVDQLADILNLTVEGRKVPPADDARIAKMDQNPIYDWSGNTTYWDSWHSMFNEDAGLLIEDILSSFPKSRILQLGLQRHGRKSQSTMKRRCREISFYMHSDDSVSIALTYDKNKLQQLLSAPHVTLQQVSEAITQRIDIRRVQQLNKGSKELLKRHGANEFKLDYDVLCPFDFRLRTQYKTSDNEEYGNVQKLLGVLGKHFFEKCQLVDLRTREILKHEQGAFRSYSNSQREWSMEKPNRYLSVHIETPDMRKNDRSQILGKGDEVIFYGLRPL